MSVVNTRSSTDICVHASINISKQLGYVRFTKFNLIIGAFDSPAQISLSEYCKQCH